MSEDTLAGRLKEARFQTAARLRETVSQDRMAELVSTQLGRVLHPTQWRRYESGEREPSLDVIIAVGRVSRLDESYLAFGNRLTDPSGAVIRPDPPLPGAAKREETVPAPRQQTAKKRKIK